MGRGSSEAVNCGASTSVFAQLFERACPSIIDNVVNPTRNEADRPNRRPYDLETYRGAL